MTIATDVYTVLVVRFLNFLKMENSNTGIAYKFVKMAWDNEKTNSYLRVNTVMFDVLQLAINANMDFGIDDFEMIFKKMSGGYWFGVNNNGKGYGEYFYERSVYWKNASAIKSFEKWTGLKAFIIKGKRMCIWSKFYDSKYQYKVTGFSEDYKRIYVVAYFLTDKDKNGKKRLLNFNNKEWLEFRKKLVLPNDC